MGGAGKSPRDPEISLAHDCGRLEVTVRRSRPCHENAGYGVFARRKFKERDVMGF